MKKSSFRIDINGMRAYAVILVVLFHFNILGFSAGFIGVDIFFVISGYLMTKIILDQIVQDRFSIWKFYLARGIRILPALLVLTIVVALVGWFLLIPEEYKTYGKHAASSVTFLSNIMYWRESSDYFSSASHEKILLHTWSLSVEWQFYIILPVLLLLIRKITKNNTGLKFSILIGFFVSLFLSYEVSQSNQTTAFYMIPTRAWEMLAGGLVYAYFGQINLSGFKRKNIEFFGFILILMSLIFFETSTLWPSINALLPVLGSMLILIANNQNSILTKPKILQWVGNASYSIYLWHWPIVFFIGYLGYQSDNLILLTGLGLSLILGGISYKYVETPTRKYLTKISTLKSYAILIIVTVVLAGVFTLIFFKNGIPERASQNYSNKVKEIVMPLPSNGWCFYSVDSIQTLKVGKDGLNCSVGAEENIKYKALLFGDSFAGHNIPFWDEIGKKLNTQVQPITTNWCYPSLGMEFPGTQPSRAFDQCVINRQFLAKNMTNYDYLIFSGFWSNVNMDSKYLAEFENLLSQTSKLDVPVIIMAAPYSFNKNIGNLYKRDAWLNKSFDLSKYMDNEHDKASYQANKKIFQLSKKYKNLIFIDRQSLYSNSNETEAGIPYSLDGGHISILGSKASAKYFQETDTYRDLKKIFR